MTAWRTIESAPKHEGAEVLGYRDGSMWVVTWWAGMPDDKSWFDGDVFRDPTHWMPLPEPPEGAE